MHINTDSLSRNQSINVSNWNLIYKQFLTLSNNSIHLQYENVEIFTHPAPTVYKYKKVSVSNVQNSEQSFTSRGQCWTFYMHAITLSRNPCQTLRWESLLEDATVEVIVQFTAFLTLDHLILNLLQVGFDMIRKMPCSDCPHWKTDNN